MTYGNLLFQVYIITTNFKFAQILRYACSHVGSAKSIVIKSVYQRGDLIARKAKFCNNRDNTKTSYVYKQLKLHETRAMSISNMWSCLYS